MDFIFKLRNKVTIDKGNFLIKEEGSKIRGCIIKVRGEGNKIVFKKKSNLNKVKIEIRGNNCLLQIGEETVVGNESYFSVKGENKSIIVGKKCMFSRNNKIMTFDGHDIFMNEKKINESKSIKIGDEVWLADGAVVLKGVQVSNGSIVGLGALLTKSYSEENIILGGNPAKIIKRGIKWKK
ncbi:MAG: acyltransferase [Fusobacteriaceae bacterium]